ncbi:MAG: hypothetical protein Q4D44_07105 [Eubacteriales bacterium]|nr:hypothetical protein [Eubacteriales bacterium]
MTDKIAIPYNDVFFYSIYLNEKDSGEVKNDIFGNIFMRYLSTLQPISNRLFRITGGDKYEYSFSFISTRPLSWRVIKNRRVIEDLEYLTEDKFYLNYYDDQGKDVKRVIFSKDNKWLKTNYYNSIYGDNLLCSIVPMEHNGETVILLYRTGAVYPVTHYCLKQASCKTVHDRVMSRVPRPELSALTNYGIIHFGTEETLNIYNQVLLEEERRYSEETKPEVFTTDDDVAGGFCFTEESFNGNGGSFNIAEALELTESDRPIGETLTAAKEEENEITEADASEETTYSQVLKIPENSSEYSLNGDLSAAIDIIENVTSIHIEEALVLDAEKPENSQEVINAQSSEIENITDEADTKDESSVSGDEITTETSEPEVSLDADALKDEEAPQKPHAEDLQIPTAKPDDDDVDEYVKSIIDSLLSNAKSAVYEYSKGESDSFSQSTVEPHNANIQWVSGNEALDSAKVPAKIIESNEDKYYFYGEYSDTGRNGRGKTLMENGFTAYEGDYLDDLRHGKGSFYFRNGDLCYYGNWSKNKRQGFGVGISSETGITHVGNWSENKPQGVGVRFDKFGNFLYLDSKSEKVNGGIRVVGFTDKSLTVEFYDEETLSMIKKEIFIDDLK